MEGKLGIYIDFDNLYGACLDFLGIKAHQGLDDNNKELIGRFLSSLLKDLINNFKNKNLIVSFVKAFAEFENLPHSKSVNIQQVLSSVGVKIITPFYVKSGKGKNKNASDIQLALEMATDFSIKKLNIDAIAIVSGDIDMYPVISWFK